MVTRRHVLFLAATLIVLGAAPATPGRIMVVTHSAGYEHDVVRRPAPGRPSLVETVLTDLARGAGSVVMLVHTREEVAALGPGAFQGVGAVVFFTTGELPMTRDARRSFLDFVREGGGFVGVHSATDTWYHVPEYGECVGGSFDGHPWHQRARIIVEDRSHPATRHLGQAFEVNDELYQFRGWSRAAVHVLLRLDLTTVEAGRGRRTDGDYALAWTRRCGRGRVFYTALGHGPEVWADARFREHLRGGLAWAMEGPR